MISVTEKEIQRKARETISNNLQAFIEKYYLDARAEDIDRIAKMPYSPDELLEILPEKI